MKSVFGDNRISLILQYFRKTPVTTVSTLASRLGVSDRTIRNDIKQLNQELKECAVIEGVQGKYSLRIFQANRFREIYSDIIQSDEFMNSSRNRMDYIFGKLMCSEEPLLTDELAYEMNIGRTTLVSDLKKLREEIKDYHLTIIGKTSKGLILHGTEADIRNYVLENSYDSIYREYPMDSEIQEAIEDFFAEHYFEKNVRESFERFVTLMLDRFLTGHYIGQLSGKYYNMTARPEFALIDDLVRQFAQILHVEIPVEETLFIFLPIMGMRTPTDIHDMHSIMLDKNVPKLTKKIFDRIHQKMDVTIESGNFTEEFLYHVMFMMNRLRFGVRLKNAMLDDLKQKYPLAYQMAGIASDVIQEEYHLKVTEDERGYLAAYFGVFLTENDLKKEKPFRIAVVCGTGRVTARLVAVQLKKMLDSSAELTLFADEKVNTEILNDFDIILTTVELSCKCDRPIIQIQEIFDEKELRHKIEKAKYWDQIDIPVLDNNWFIMNGLLDENRFFVFDEEETYESALEQMVENLEIQGYVDEDFMERLREREKKGTMVFDREIAIPHAIQYAGDKLVLSVGVFSQNTGQGQQEIKVIFLIGLPADSDMEDDLLLRVYDEIINVAQDKKLLHKISKADSFSTLIQALYRQAGD